MAHEVMVVRDYYLDAKENPQVSAITIIDLLTVVESFTIFEFTSLAEKARDLLERAIDADANKDARRLRGLWHLAQDMLREMGFTLHITVPIHEVGMRYEIRKPVSPATMNK